MHKSNIATLGIVWFDNNLWFIFTQPGQAGIEDLWYSIYFILPPSSKKQDLSSNCRQTSRIAVT
jgi:hypothetical protein